MSGRNAFGRQAEASAEHYLRRKGYRIVDRNARCPHGELDLVVERAGVLVFVEVKARRTSAFGGAPYAVDGRKRERLIRLAAHYLAQRKLKQQLCRFDVVLCTGAGDRPGDIQHIENAFDVPGDQLQW